MAYRYGTNYSETLNGTNSRDFIYGYGGNDRLFGFGGNDDVYGGAGHDDLYGGAGDDYLSGGTGDDLLVGGTGDDDLYGGDGHDDLVGGAGQDFLTGGYGQDAFIFNAVADSPTGYYERDVITDFTLDVDIIDVANIDANTGMTGNQKFFWDDYESNPNNTDRGSLSYRYVDGNTIISGNTDSDSTIEFQIELKGTCDLASYDFFL